mmetsp:Transcript_4789/g.13337  ORF Transcript_4789/g.13337 Transcript_4789/m.13337 type:complete len:208 (-) Transcript_4789:448-1071(-)
MLSIIWGVSSAQREAAWPTNNVAKVSASGTWSDRCARATDTPAKSLHVNSSIRSVASFAAAAAKYCNVAKGDVLASSGGSRRTAAHKRFATACGAYIARHGVAAAMASVRNSLAGAHTCCGPKRSSVAKAQAMLEMPCGLNSGKRCVASAAKPKRRLSTFSGRALPPLWFAAAPAPPRLCDLLPMTWNEAGLRPKTLAHAHASIESS